MKPETEALLRYADAIRPSDGDIGCEGEPYRDAFDMLMDIVGDNPQPLARWEGRDWMRLLNVLVSERARADKNADVVAELVLALRDAEQRTSQLEGALLHHRGYKKHFERTGHCLTCGFDRDDAEQRAAAGEADTRRLDWLEDRRAWVEDLGFENFIGKDSITDDEADNPGRLMFEVNAGSVCPRGSEDFVDIIGHGYSLREAIDGAISTINAALTHDGGEDAAPREEPKP